MDSNLAELSLKETLVELEDIHEHLQGAVKHLEKEIHKREIDIKKLLSERELGELMIDNSDCRKRFKTQPEDKLETVGNEYSSEFAKEVEQLVSSIARVSEEISGLIKL